MADRKISDLTALTTPAAGDYLPIVDISEASAANKNKRITIEELLRGAPDGTAAAPSIGFESDPNTGIYSPGADQVAISTGGTERARIDSSGRLLVGTSTTSSGARIVVQGITSDSNYGGVIGLKRGTSPGTSDWFGFLNFADDVDVTVAQVYSGRDGGTWSSTSKPSKLVFSTTADGTTSLTERMRIDNTGLITIAGPGIKFPAAQVASADPNTLDDYEEGTWTPLIVGLTNSGTGTYTDQAGFYTKVGNVVHITLRLIWTAHTGTGNMAIGGLPFTSNSTSTARFAFAHVHSDIALTANNVLQISLANSSTSPQILQVPTGGGASASVPVDTAGTLFATCSYIV